MLTPSIKNLFCYASSVVFQGLSFLSYFLFGPLQMDANGYISFTSFVITVLALI